MIFMSSEETLKNDALEAHRAKKGKIEVIGKVAVKETRDLALYYTPGVAYPCLAIKDDKNLSYEYTSRANTVVILTNGGRVLGLGNIGPEASMPVMEGKALLLKKFGCIDATPLAVTANSEDELVAIAKAIAPSFGAMNLEDIEAPEAINVLRRLDGFIDIPVFHDDSYGTGVVVYAALKNALKLVGKRLRDVRVVMNGTGSAGTGIVEMLLAAGVRNLIMCDRSGTLYKGRTEGMNPIKVSMAERTNAGMLKGTLADAVKGADVLIGASTKGAFSRELIASMAEKPIVFALANPYPEIEYKEAKEAGAAIVATGRSDMPNQVNNMLAFPGILRGLLDVRASKVDTSMLIAAGDAVAAAVKKSQLNSEYLVPGFSDSRMAVKTTANVAFAVAKTAISAGLARITIDPQTVKDNYIKSVKRYRKIEKLIERI